MIVVDIPKSLNSVAKELIKHTGPAKYWIHSEVGGDGWKAEHTPYLPRTRVTLDDDKGHLATFILLSMK